jgi:futalosine hydrolase
VKKKITIVAATQGEIIPLLEHFEKTFIKNHDFRYTSNDSQLTIHNSRFTHFQSDDLDVDILITGIGILHSTYSLMNYLADHHPDAWIQIGIGGAYDKNLQIGEVYLIESEVLVDFGAQDSNGRIINQFDLGWMDPHQYPYVNEVLPCPFIPSELIMPVASGMTTMYSHGYADKIQKIEEGLHGQIESMEGAAFFYVSLMKKIPFLSLRSISNYVEPRDISKWEINKAIEKLKKETIKVLSRIKLLF